ncbi:hypothetical protein [Sinorhizobium meliloti]
MPTTGGWIERTHFVDACASLWVDGELADNAVQSGRAAPFAAADLVSAIRAVRPDAEPLAWALADELVASVLNWPVSMLLVVKASPVGPAVGAAASRLNVPLWRCG